MQTRGGSGFEAESATFSEVKALFYNFHSEDDLIQPLFTYFGFSVQRIVTRSSRFSNFGSFLKEHALMLP